MDISCAFPPHPGVADHVAYAEELGYRRAWLYDSAILYGDVWMHLALCAQRTSSIGLGPAVLVPGFRHPLAQASAIATLEQLAPGRVAVAIGTGFTGRMALGQKPHTWSETTHYISTVQKLLAGETVEIDGSLVEMIPPPGYLPNRPMQVPMVVAANGPKGLAAAESLGADGVMSVLGGQPDWDWSALLTFGTVLEDGEPADSDRAVAAAGPGFTAALHGMYEADPTSVASLPGSEPWLQAIESVPVERRHLALHEGHLDHVTERDRPLVSGDLIRAFTWTGSPEEIRARVDGFAQSGGTEVLYAPAGPDIARELRAFADACSSGQD